VTDLRRPLVGIRARRRSAALAAAVGPPRTAPKWIGLEHEYVVRDSAGVRADFRDVIHGLRLGRRDLAPLDRNAYPQSTGSVITADTTEAEIAVPPVTLGPGFVSRIDGWATFERDRLALRIAPLSLLGDSTHISITMPSSANPDEIADLFARRFALGLMMLLDRRHSPGLLVRPRPFRLELGGEYASGGALRAAVAFAVGGALACMDAARSRSVLGLPPALVVHLERGVLRYGWYVARTAFGGDLYAAGRSTVIDDDSGKGWQAGDYLAATWSVSRSYLSDHVDNRDLVECDAVVAGRAPLPLELGGDAAEIAPIRLRPRSPFGAAVRSRQRPDYEMAPVMLTWEAVVFLLRHRHRARLAYAVVPGHQLERFLWALDQGQLDDDVCRYLALPPAGRRLHRLKQARNVGLYDELGLRVALLAAERDYWGRPIRLRLLPLMRRTRRQRPHDRQDAVGR
jgi:hypothetical protein